jgi:hypothetical protein
MLGAAIKDQAFLKVSINGILIGIMAGQAGCYPKDSIQFRLIERARLRT